VSKNLLSFQKVVPKYLYNPRCSKLFPLEGLMVQGGLGFGVGMAMDLAVDPILERTFRRPDATWGRNRITRFGVPDSILREFFRQSGSTGIGDFLESIFGSNIVERDIIRS
jgi:hypothetical protein